MLTVWTWTLLVISRISLTAKGTACYRTHPILLLVIYLQETLCSLARRDIQYKNHVRDCAFQPAPGLSSLLLATTKPLLPAPRRPQALTHSRGSGCFSRAMKQRRSEKFLAALRVRVVRHTHIGSRLAMVSKLKAFFLRMVNEERSLQLEAFETRAPHGSTFSSPRNCPCRCLCRAALARGQSASEAPEAEAAQGARRGELQRLHGCAGYFGEKQQ